MPEMGFALDKFTLTISDIKKITIRDGDGNIHFMTKYGKEDDCITIEVRAERWETMFKEQEGKHEGDDLRPARDV